MVKNLLFAIWSLTLIILAAYVLFIRKGSFLLNEQLLSCLIFINLIVGAAFIVFHALNFIKLIVRSNSKFLRRSTIIILLGGCFILFLRSRNLTLLPKSITTSKVVSLATDLKNYYLNLVFDFFGYPFTEQMTSADQLWQAVNSYRTGRGIPRLMESTSLCKLAQEKLDTMALVSYTSRFESVKTYSDVAEVLQTIYEPLKAQSVIDYRWSRPLNRVRKLIQEDSWQYGCIKIKGLHIVLILGK